MSGFELALPALVQAAGAASWIQVAATALVVVSGLQQASKAKRAARAAWEASLQDRKIMIRSAEAPRTITYGRDKVSGPLVYACTSGPYSEYLHVVVALAGHEIDAIEEIYLGDDPLGTLDGNGYVQAGSKFYKTSATPRQENVVVSGGQVTLSATPVSVTSIGYQEGGWDGYSFVFVSYSQAGSVLTVDTALNGYTLAVSYVANEDLALVQAKKFLGVTAGERDTALETASSGQWTADHLGKGVARVRLTLRYDPDVFGGGLPNISAVIRGKKVLDTRTSTTAWTTNAALIARDYIVSTQGFGEASGAINTTAINAAANICDESVTTASGTQSRYTANGTLSTEDNRIENLSMILSAMVGTAVRSGGEWIIRAGAYVTPTLDLTDDDLADGAISLVPALPKRELFNGVRGKIVDPAQSYASVDFPPYKSATYVSADGGEALYRDITLPMTNDAEAAQRIAKLMLHRARQALAFSATFNLRAYRLQPGDTFRMTATLFGWTNKVFRVVERRLTQPGVVQIQAQEEAAAVYDWTYTEATGLDPAPNTDLPDPSVVAAITGLTPVAALRLGSDGVWRIDLSATWTASSDAAVRFGGQIEIVAENAATGALMTRRASGTDTSAVLAENILGSSAWNVRARAYNGVAFSAWAFAASYYVDGPTDAPAAPTGFSAGTEPFGVRLTWTASTSIDVAEYLLRIGGSSWATATPIGSVKATSFLWQTQATGATTFRIKAVDAWGNESTEVTAAVTTTVPAVSSLAVSVDGDSALLTWAAPATSFAISDYEIRVGSTYAGSTLLGYARTTFDRRRITGSGTIRYWITARDVAGNLGGSPTSVDLAVSVPATPTVTSEIVDNNILLRWNDCTTTLPVVRYELYRDATLIGDNGDGRFAVLFEQAGGSFTYGVKAYDSAGNASSLGTVGATVSAPPDYVLRATFDSTLSGTRTNAVLYNGVVLAPMYDETDAEHTTRLGTLLGGTPTDDDAITAGYDQWWEPGHTTSSYVETFDIGSTVDPSTITVIAETATVQGVPSVAYQVKCSTTGAFAGEEQTYAGSQVYASSAFRYVKVTLTITGSGGDDLISMSALRVKVATKLKSDSGVVTVSSNPATVTLSGDIDIETIISIVLTPSGTAARHATWTYTSGTSFSVYLWDATGAAATGDVAWTVRGV